MLYYPHTITDYRGATRELELVEHGAYRLLMDEYYLYEKPLPGNWNVLYRIAGAFSPREQKAVKRVVEQFFVNQGGDWVHARIEEEISHYSGVRKRNQENGKNGGRPRKDRGAVESGKGGEVGVAGAQSKSEPNQNPNGNPVGYDSQTEIKANKEEEEDEEDNSLIPLARDRGESALVLEADEKALRLQRKREFEVVCEEIYQAYPKKVAKPKALQAIGKALKKLPAPELLAKVRSYAGSVAGEDLQFVPHPATWFNGERWNDGTHSEPSVQKNKKEGAVLGQDFNQDEAPQGWREVVLDLYGEDCYAAWTEIPFSVQNEIRRELARGMAA